jgi:hypothetical protein
MWDEAFALFRASNLTFFPPCTSFDEITSRQLLLDAQASSSTAAAMVDNMVAMGLVDG